jgi:P-type Cu+ transporter
MRGEQAMTSTISPVGQVRDDALPVVAAVEAAPVHLRPIGRDAGCAVLTLAVLAVAVTDPGHPAWAGTALALAAVAVGWGGGPAFHSAWAAMRRGAVTVDTLTGVGLLAVAATALIAALGHPADLGPTVVAAAAATLRCAGGAVEGRLTAADGEARGDGPVERARRGAAVLQRAADRAVGGFAAVVVVLAVATLGFWLGTGAGVLTALGAAAAVLLVGCPHAVGRAAGTALVVGTSRAAALGAFLDGPRSAEALARVDTVVLCRTGTLTTGARALQAVHVTEGVDADEALRIAGAVAAAGREAGGAAGTHPVGAVVADAARTRFGTLPGVAEFDGYPGLGVRGIVTELLPCPDACTDACADTCDEPRVMAHAALVGRVSLLTAHGIDLPADLEDTLAEIHARGATAVAVSWDGVARALLEVADPVRPGVPDAVDGLRALGLRPVVLTGDDEGAARGLATALAVEEVVAELRPADRGDAVARLREAGRTVAVVGGPGDEAALAAADVALGRDGTMRLVGSGVALHDDDPLTAVDALRTARRTARTVERTITGAAAYHLVAVPLAATGLLHPLAAALAAACYPVVALLHAAALRRVPALPRPEPA